MKRFISEFIAKFFLLAIVASSGIMGERLAQRNAAITLFTNNLATGANLMFLILTFGEISGAQMNPAISWFEFWRGKLNVKNLFGYISAQVFGASGGVGNEIKFLQNK